MRGVGIALVVGLCAGIGTGCASIIHGTTQTVTVSPVDRETRVFVDGQRLKETSIVLARRDDHIVSIERVGCRPRSLRIRSGLSGLWAVNALVPPWLVSFGLDLIIGGAFRLDPEHIEAEADCVATSTVAR